MTDNRMKGRVKGLFGTTTTDNNDLPTQGANTMNSLSEPDSHQALQVLVLAQRTADEHVAAAQQQAEKIRSSARATADQIAREAHAYVDDTRREADKALADAMGLKLDIRNGG